jgi:pantetheine-phosphate adenylyltransferase
MECSAMRIISGSRRGHRIAAPKGRDTRPTSDRVRENAFNLIGPVDDAEVLDLFAGSGALGLEALSRGAAHATFVENDRDACRVIGANLDKLGLRGTVLCQDALRPRALRPAVRLRHGPAGAPPGEAPRGRRRARLGDVRPPGRAGGAGPSATDDAQVRFCAAYPVRDVITAIYPGTYDPVTNGHVDVITRAARIFDRVVVGVVDNPHHKTPMFPVPERVAFLEQALEGIVENVEVDVFSQLVVDFARRWNARAIVKGLRVVSDFEWEFQMNQLNRTLAPDIETVYVMASPQVSFVSSSGVKEIASFGGNVEELVPKPVAVRLKEMFPNGRAGTPVSDQE